MEKKTGMIFVTFFALAMFLGFTSATLTVSNIPLLNQSGGTFTFNVSSTVNETVTVNIDSIIQGTNQITFSISPPSFELNDTLNNRTKKITVDYVVDSGFLFELGKTYSTTMNVSGNVSEDLLKIITFEESNFCNEIDNKGNLEVRTFDINVEKGFGDSDSFWYLLDEISVEIDVDNRGSWDIQNIDVEWELDTTDGSKIMDGDVNDFDLNYGDGDTVTITFKLDENLRRFDGEDAVLYVRATGKIDDRNSPYDGQKSCAFRSKEVNVITRDDFMIVDDLTLNGEKVSRGDFLDNNAFTCNSKVDVAATVYNLGRDEQKESYVMVYNKDLGINERIDLDNINGFKSQDISMDFNIPSDAKEKNYKLQFEVYDKRDNLFQNGENDDAISNFHFKVEGNCDIVAPTITAELDSSEAKEGEEMVVKVYLRNDEDKPVTFLLGADGFGSWANLIEISPQTFTLAYGTAQEVYLTFNLKGDSAGDRQFNLVITSEGKVITTKPILVTVQEGSFWSNTFIEGIDLRIVGIVVLNLILIIAIILVARKVLKRR